MSRQEQETHDGVRDEQQRVREPVTAQAARERRSSARSRSSVATEARGEQERVDARLLRPLDDERARCKKETAHQGDPPVEELASEHDEKGRSEHRPDDGREPQGPFRGSREGRPRLLDPVVERLVALELRDVSLVNLPPGVRLVEPESGRSEPDEPEDERNGADDPDVESERARPQALEQARAA